MKKTKIINDEITSKLNQSTLTTNIINNLNPMTIPLDSQYLFSTIGLSKKLPLTRKNINNKNLTPFSPQFFSDKDNNKLIQNNSTLSINREKSEIETYKKKPHQFFIMNKKIANLKKLKLIRKEKSVDTLNIKMQFMNHYLRKQKEKMNRTKFKFFKILMNHNKNECIQFKNKNDEFNERLKLFFRSNFFYKKIKDYHKQFHFGKDFLNMGKDSTKHHMDFINNDKNIKLNSDLVLNLLNDEDKKLIYSDPYFFLRDNQYLYKLTKTKIQTLIDRLKEEDKKNNENKSVDEDLNVKNIYKNVKPKSVQKIQKKIRNFPKLTKSNTMKTMKEEIPYLDEKQINRIINEDLNNRLKHLQKGISPVEKEMIETVTKLNTYKKNYYIFQGNKRFYKTYHIRTNEDYFKPFLLGKNRERLIKEKLFCKELNKRNFNNNKDKIIIQKYQRQLEEHYNKIKVAQKLN